eukprot:TRINITY_DN577_c0_g1_i1.p1 TRINITY_DN577_c0_g1~~TRINITY_DN577_c0_g1_i1.p1  ORF type:complete len:385 (+),score=85.99 TRINITY_DN577_c0_g1_i1:124-1278(+)
MNNDQNKERQYIYITYPKKLQKYTNCHQNEQRFEMVNSLIESINIFNDNDEHIIVERLISFDFLKKKPFNFDNDFINALQQFIKLKGIIPFNQMDHFEFYQLQNDDTPYFEGLSIHILLICTGTFMATTKLLHGSKKVAINWVGGRHHGSRCYSSGFCYVNDIIIAASMLRKTGKTLIIDLDIHLGDGTSESFCHDDRVFYLSVHRHPFAFFPAKTTGLFEYSHGSNLNLPLWNGLDDESLKSLLIPLLAIVVPQSHNIILVLGADILKEFGIFNVSIPGMLRILSCVKDLITSQNVLILGGGGYDNASTASYWTQVTALFFDRLQSVPNEIPESYEYIHRHVPNLEFNYELDDVCLNRNKEEDLKTLGDKAEIFLKSTNFCTG